MTGMSTDVIAAGSGFFLSGAMTSLSAIAVPVILDTVKDPAILFNQWARLYHYGHLMLPTLGVSTFGLYAFAALTRRAAKRSWVPFALAGTVTVSMVPFTWIFMVPTNNILFGLQAEGSAVGASLAEGRDLVVKWSWLHLIRSMLPLIGTAVGLRETLSSM